MTIAPLAIGATLPVHAVTSLQGVKVSLPVDGVALTHLQFRRFAGCPICNLHLRGLAARIGELRAAGVAEVAVFRSTEEQMRPYQGDLPFVVVADPELELVRAFGVERSGLRAVVDPHAWGAALKGVVSVPSAPLARGDHLALPSEFLIDAGGVVVARKLGTHADDEWSVDELLALARDHAPP